jgi:hypothetical protein
MSSQNMLVCIISHERAKNVQTYKALRSQGYTGEIVIIVDSEDGQLKDYEKTFGEQLHVYDKHQKQGQDAMDNFGITRTALYARNAAIDYAKSKGISNFALFDDDLKNFKFVSESQRTSAKDLDKIFEAMFEFLRIENVGMVAFRPQGQMFGGNVKWSNKPANAVFIKAENGYYSGTRAEDDIYSCNLWKHGKACIVVPYVTFETPKRGSNDGGLHEDYEKNGMYQAVMYSKINNPTDCEITFDGKDVKPKTTANYRCPKIIGETWKK